MLYSLEAYEYPASHQTRSKKAVRISTYHTLYMSDGGYFPKLSIV